MNIIDLGSGPHPKMDANIRVDFNPWPNVTHVHDLNIFPYPFESNSAQKIYLGDVIEHVSKFDAPLMVGEIYRILKPNGILEITCPDFRWIAERIVYNDWHEKANVEWLNRNEDPWDNAMDYWFGGWRNINEYKMPGMGHINGFDEKSLNKLLSSVGFINIVRIKDNRNPSPACDSILKLIAYK